MSTDVALTTHPGLDERVVILRAGNLVDAVVVRTERFNVLVDTLDTPDRCRAALDRLGHAVRDRPLVVVNSHMDWDHFWGNAAVPDGTIIIAHDKALERFAGAAVRDVLARKRDKDARFGAVELRAPNLTFSDRLRLDGGDLTLELFPTPGHTPDHVAVWIPELRTCLAVDAVERPIPKVWSDDPQDLRTLVATLRTIQDLGAEHVVLAHGQTSSPATVERNLRYFERLVRHAQPFGRDGEPLDEAGVPEGLRLRDLVDGLDDLEPDALAFYERFHWSNLKAALRSHREQATSSLSQDRAFG